jgi:alpha-tubulin suppressor-like RCC1 family protein
MVLAAMAALTLTHAAQGQSVVAWGRNIEGQCSAPTPNNNFVAVAGGSLHTLGLKANGKIVVWVSNAWGERDVPGPNGGFVAIAGGWHHSLGLR